MSRSRAAINVLLRLDPEIEIVSECGSGAEALAEIRRAKPDLVFLDVQMPECDGFDVLELLGNDLPPAIVFVTAYDQYALRAFEAGALDYLLKPFDDARFALRSAAPRKGSQMSEIFLRTERWRSRAPDDLFCKNIGDRLDRGRGLLRMPARRNENHLLRRSSVWNLSRNWSQTSFAVSIVRQS